MVNGAGRPWVSTEVRKVVTLRDASLEAMEYGSSSLCSDVTGKGECSFRNEGNREEEMGSE